MAPRIDLPCSQTLAVHSHHARWRSPRLVRAGNLHRVNSQAGFVLALDLLLSPPSAVESKLTAVLDGDLGRRFPA
jgi:hypothetical protein